MSAPYQRLYNDPHALGQQGVASAMDPNTQPYIHQPATWQQGVPPQNSARNPNTQPYAHEQPGQPAFTPPQTAGYDNQPPPPPYTQPLNPRIQTQYGTISDQPVLNITLPLERCPECEVGILQERFNPCLLLLAILCFPLGCICLLCSLEKRCNNCGHAAPIRPAENA